MVEVNPAAGGLVDIAYVAETEFGSTPASTTFQRYPTRRTSLNVGKDNYKSEIRSRSRQRKNSKHGYKNIGGDLMSELATVWHDSFFEALLGGTWATGVVAVPHATVSALTNGGKITCASATFLTDGFKVGDIFRWNNNPNLRHMIASVSETEIEVYGSTLQATAAASNVFAVVGKKLTVGNTARSFSIERFFSNLGLYQVFRGCRINTGRLNVPPTGIPECDFGVMGQDAGALSSTSAASTYASAPVTEPMSSIHGALYIGTDRTEIGLLTGFDLSMSNAMSGDKVAFRNTVPTINFGRYMDVSGNLTILFNGATHYNRFINEDETPIHLVIYDGDAPDTDGFLRITMSRVKFNTGDLDDSADTSIPMSVSFEALEPLTSSNGSEGANIVIQRSNT